MRTRRALLGSMATAAAVGLAGCGADGGSRTPSDDNEDYFDYEDVEADHFELESVFISRNAPTDIGVSITAVSEQFAGETLPVDVKLLDEKGDVVFHKPVFGIGLDGGTENTETCWFTVENRDALFDAYVPKVRIRTDPPN